MPAFASRILPACPQLALEDPNHWIWCGSAERGDDGTWHLFASRWSKRLPFHPGWLFSSTIVRCESDRPEGPYRVVEEVLPPRGSGFWDGRTTHNPAIRRHGGKWLLFYLGVSYEGPEASAEHPVLHASERYHCVWNRKRIGVAVADDPRGPWTRPDRPLFEPDPHGWDATVTTNPSPWIHADGSVLMAYKSRRASGKPLHIGTARAAHWSGPYERWGGPIAGPDGSLLPIEDPFLWYEDGEYQMIAKEMTGRWDALPKGRWCGEHHGALHLCSADGKAWRIADQPLALTRRIVLADGRHETLANRERPSLIFQGGRPTHLLCATTQHDFMDGDPGRAGIMVWPLAGAPMPSLA